MSGRTHPADNQSQASDITRYFIPMDQCDYWEFEALFAGDPLCNPSSPYAVLLIYTYSERFIQRYSLKQAFFDALICMKNRPAKTSQSIQ